MKVFLDTNVLIAAMVQKHAAHERALAVLERVQNGTDAGLVSAHSLAELYGILTKLPPPWRHAPEQALITIQENVLGYFDIISLDGADYRALIREAALAGIQGGTIYDAVLLKSAGKAAVDQIYTLNLKYFAAVASGDLRAKLREP